MSGHLSNLSGHLSNLDRTDKGTPKGVTLDVRPSVLQAEAEDEQTYLCLHGVPHWDRCDDCGLDFMLPNEGRTQ